jgi:hypothetical protein
MTTKQGTDVPRDAAQQQLDALKAQRSALTDQLLSQTIRRDLLKQQLARSSGQAATSLQDQLNALDASVKATTGALARIDNAVNDAATNALPGGPTGTAVIDARLEQFEQALVKVGTVGGLGLAAIVAVVILSLRRRRPSRSISPEDSMRLDHLQRAVDVIAVEVERISEAQRYMAKNAAEDKRIVDRER